MQRRVFGIVVDSRLKKGHKTTQEFALAIYFLEKYKVVAILPLFFLGI